MGKNSVNPIFQAALRPGFQPEHWWETDIQYPDIHIDSGPIADDPEARNVVVRPSDCVSPDERSGVLIGHPGNPDHRIRDAHRSHPTGHREVQDRFPFLREPQDITIDHGLKSGIVPFAGIGPPTVSM